MHDPREGVTARGTITTGAARRRVPEEFEPVLAAAVDGVAEAGRDVALYVYGSVATGTARVGRSDVDLLTVDLPAEQAGELGGVLSVRFRDRCRAVEVAAASRGDFAGETDEAYGGRVFLRHYCVHLTGPDHDRSTADFPADERAARGFNGDIGRHAIRWRARLADGDEPAELGRVLARKTLLAVASLVSVVDRNWTTDRELAARRWSVVHPQLASGLTTAVGWANGRASADAASVARALDELVDPIVESFAVRPGLWPDPV